MLPLYGGADFAIPFPPVCGSADNPPPVLSAKISANVLFRSYSTSPFGNRIWRKKTAHTIKFLPYQNPFWGFTPNPTREIISLRTLIPSHKHRLCEKSGQGHDALVGVLGAKSPRSSPKVLNILLVVAEVFQQEITVAPILLHLYPKL